MAGRSSIGAGLGTLIFFLAVATLGLLVTTALLFTKYKEAQRDYQAASAQINDIITPAERNQDQVTALMSAAKSSRKSLVGYMTDGMGQAMTMVTGSKNDTPSSLEARVKGIVGDTNSGKPLVTLLSEQKQQIQALQSQKAQAEAAQQAALNDLKDQTDRVKRIEVAHGETVAALMAKIDENRQGVTELREGTETFKKTLDERAEQAQAEAAADKKRLGDQIAKLTEENVVLRGQLDTLRGERNTITLKPTDEFALVDGQIIAVEGATRRAYISIGSEQRLPLGMTFSVYSNAASIRPEGEGYAPGKATLEVINVEASSATCRILSESRGNPIVAGDVIANAVFDPNKTYKFLVYGNFDANRDGVSTPDEAQDVGAMITSWGGSVIKELQPDVDFLVLGERPVLPPQPAPDASFEVFREFKRLQDIVQKYDDLYRQGVAASVPILNENRLYTLTGKVPARVRATAER